MQEQQCRKGKTRLTLKYPSHWLKPEELLSFIELKPFMKGWNGLGLSDEDLALLQVGIMAQPNAGSVIRGTGGVRKLRVAPDGWGKGKSGALRVCYLYVQEVQIVILALVYSKSNQDNLSPEERRTLKDFVSSAKMRLLQNHYRCTVKAVGLKN